MIALRGLVTNLVKNHRPVILQLRFTEGKSEAITYTPCST